MGFKDVLNKIGEKRKAQKELIKRMSDQVRFEKLVEDRQKSSNQRELERYMEEDRQIMIKERLEYARKKRSDEINFGHNPLDAKNIMKAEWEVMKEKNQFSKKSDMFTNQNSVLKNDNKLLRTNKQLLKSNDNLMKGGSMFKI